MIRNRGNCGMMFSVEKGSPLEGHLKLRKAGYKYEIGG